MASREAARLLRPDSPAEGDDDTDGDNGGGVKSGFSMLVGVVAGNLIGGTASVSGAVPGIGIRILWVWVIVVALDRVLDVSRQRVPPAMTRALARIG